MSNYNHNSHQRRGGIPPRWLNCPRKSEGFIADKFLVFKTPLDSRYDDAVPIQSRFPPNMILEHMRMKQLKIGLWIDLTNTDRFYDKTLIQPTEYVKVQCRGHGETPTREQATTFIQICRDFIARNDMDYIGVHCTHGFNRSGFLICSFLVEEFDFSITSAVALFGKLRPPGIYKEDYIRELWTRYGDGDEQVGATPVRPAWCEEEEEEDDDDRGQGQQQQHSHEPAQKRSKNGSGSEPKMKRRKAEFVKEDAVFMAGVSNVDLVTDPTERLHIQRKVQDMCGWTGHGFPGSQPVSMDVKNIHKLTEKPYMVSWKADGTRYLFLIEDRGRVFFIDRDNSIFSVEGMTFPTRKVFHEHVKETLCDGEMVIDVVDGVNTPRFLIYDIIRFEGQEVGKIDFPRRLKCIKDEIVKPRYDAIVRGLINRQEEPFGVRLKDFWPVENTAKLLNGNFQLPHEPDGTIFQPEKDPYECGRCDNVLKWKPPELNTIDFRLKVCTLTGEGLVPTRIGELYVGQLQTPFGKIQPLPKKLIPLDGKIVECNFDGRGWSFLRERTDKSFPNAYSTATAVAFSISNPVRKDYLLEFIARKRYREDPVAQPHGGHGHFVH